MISTSNVTLRVGKKALFEDVSIKFIEETATDSSVPTVPESLPFTNPVRTAGTDQW